MTPNERPNRPNILIFVLDATRARHLSCYGYGRETSPNADRVASRGVLYEQCISPASWTLPSMASMFTGLYVSQHGTNFHHQNLDPRYTTIAEMLGKHSYQTALFSPGGWLSETFGMSRGFESVFDYVDRYRWIRRFSKQTTKLEKLARQARRYLLGSKRGKMSYELARDLRRWFAKLWEPNRPFFVVAHFADPHWPWFYHPGSTWTEADPKPPRSFAPDGVKFISGQLQFTERQRAMMVDYYDGEIRFMDGFIGSVIDALQAGGQLDDTLLVITSDHGEELTEHGLMGHGLSMYENVLHVPLILHHPTKFAGGQRVREAVQSIDLFPTILDLLEIDRNGIQNQLRGQSLEPADVQIDPRAYTISERLAPSLRRFHRVVPEFDTTAFERPLRAIRARDGYKLIWGSDGRHELYNLERDPNEKVNLAELEPEEVRRLHTELENWLSEIGESTLDPLEARIDEVVGDRLRDLGYL